MLPRGFKISQWLLKVNKIKSKVLSTEYQHFRIWPLPSFLASRPLIASLSNHT